MVPPLMCTVELHSEIRTHLAVPNPAYVHFNPCHQDTSLMWNFRLSQQCLDQRIHCIAVLVIRTLHYIKFMNHSNTGWWYLPMLWISFFLSTELKLMQDHHSTNQHETWCLDKCFSKVGVHPQINSFTTSVRTLMGPIHTLLQYFYFTILDVHCT